MFFKKNYGGDEIQKKFISKLEWAIKYGGSSTSITSKSVSTDYLISIGDNSLQVQFSHFLVKTWKTKILKRNNSIPLVMVKRK